MSWKTYRLGDILERKRVSVKIEKDKLYKLVTIKLYHQGVILREEKKGDDIKSNMFSVNTGDFILSGIDARNGAFGIVPKELDGAIVTNDFWILEPNPKIMKKDFFLFITSTPLFDYICKQCSDGTTQRIRLQRDKFYDYELSLPSIDAQRLLVDKLTNYNKNCKQLSTELTHQLTLVKQLRQSFLREAMQGKLTADFRSAHPELIEGENSAQALLENIKAEKKQLIKDGKLKKEKELAPIGEDEIPFDIPESWVWCRLGEIIFDTEGGKSPNCLNEEAIGDEWGVIKTTAVQEMIFLENENKVLPKGFMINEQHKIKVGDLLITRAGPKNRVGIVCYVEKLSTNLILSDKTIRIKYNNDLINAKYIALALNSPLIKPIIERKMTGMADSQVNISQDNMKGFTIPLPPLSEQQAIVSKLDELMRTCDELEVSIRTSQQQNEMLLREVLREALEKPKEEIREVLMAAESIPTYKIPVQSNIPDNKRGFAKQVLGGKIVEEFKDDKNFTHIKFQKLQYLAEQIIEENLEWNYYRQMAGPYDNKFMHSVFNRLEKNSWFRKSGNKYQPLGKVNDIDKYYQNYFGDKSEKLNNLFGLLQRASEKFCEAIATIYAVWNNHIILKLEFDKERVKADFFDWSNRKTVVFTEEEFEKALVWMQNHDIIPTGFGYLIKEKK